MNKEKRKEIATQLLEKYQALNKTDDNLGFLLELACIEGYEVAIREEMEINSKSLKNLNPKLC
ncbi:MAG: hypothetical protein PHQ20_03645 [Candidatus Moranbacteria bacterium]|nr:hypothetical protein [Candidatus Moranbacteria bacterium]